MRKLLTFWKFTRPHTIIGSAVSVSALAFMGGGIDIFGTAPFAFAMVSALACNVFITGYNQVTDVATDKINKPELPLASGEMQIETGKRITRLSGLTAAVFAALVSWWFLAFIFSIGVLGFLYSWRAVFLKKRHLSAATAISAVRGLLVNIGFYMLFAGTGSITEIPPEIWLLTSFVVLFSLGIAWFKDIPDVRGDAQAEIGTLAVTHGAERAYLSGTVIVGAGYAAGIAVPFSVAFSHADPWFVSAGHLMAGLAFAAFAAKTDPRKHEEIRRFYRLFWVLFFAEYIIFAAAFGAA